VTSAASTTLPTPSIPPSEKRSTAKVRILLVDDHPLIRKGFADVIQGEPDLELCGEASGRAEAAELVTAHRPDVIVLDLCLSGQLALDLIREVGENARVLILSMQPETIYAGRALAAGASGYIMKHESVERVLEAIRTVASGKVYASAAIKDDILRSVSGRRASDSGMKSLSDRELEVFSLIGKGLPTREIARLLCLSRKTVETHRENIKRKLSVKLSSELAVRAAAWLLEHSAY
jgi:DNA-binding NarL/FixJ family response regulator